MATPDTSTPSDLAFLALPDGRRIAHRFTPGIEGSQAPGIVFLPGYRSDMAGSKATAIFDWARAHGRACLCLDYSGCGLSSGEFADGTLSRWRDEVLALITEHRLAKVILVGSSMGGWLMLLVGAALGWGRVAGLVGIAAAPDFTQWGTSPAHQAELAAGRVLLEPNPYGPEPTPTYPGFWADGQAQRQLDGHIACTAPVRLLHGQADPDVPWAISLRLAAALRSDDVQVTLVKDGDHRLSRAADIALIVGTLEVLVNAAALADGQARTIRGQDER